VGALRIASFGIASFGIASFEIASFSTKGSNCFLCGRLASFEYGCLITNNDSRTMFHVFGGTHMIMSPATANDQYRTGHVGGGVLRVPL
jgi:hypothetical protein